VVAPRVQKDGASLVEYKFYAASDVSSRRGAPKPGDGDFSSCVSDVREKLQLALTEREEGGGGRREMGIHSHLSATTMAPR